MDDSDQHTVSQIIITFSSPDSTVMNIDVKSVSPLQAIAAAWLLQKQAEVGFFQQQAREHEREEMGKIAVPSGVRRVASR